VELLGEVRLDGVKPKRRRCDSGEGEQVLGSDDLDLTEHRVAEGHVHAEGLAVDLAREPALRLVAVAVVSHGVPGDLRVVPIWPDLEDHEVAQRELGGGLQFVEEVTARSGQAEVDVLGGARPLQPELEHEATLQDGGVSEGGGDPGQEPVEDEQLPPPGEVHAACRCALEAVLQRPLERGRGIVALRLHRALPAVARPGRARRASSALGRSPRSADCRMA
jgi:hypothetical protein